MVWARILTNNNKETEKSVRESVINIVIKNYILNFFKKMMKIKREIR